MPFERLKTYVSNEVCSGRLDKNAAAARGEVLADVIPSKSVRFGVEVRLLGRAPHVLGATVRSKRARESLDRGLSSIRQTDPLHKQISFGISNNCYLFKGASVNVVYSPLTSTR